MARYEIRIAFEDPADAKVQHQRWSIACDAGRSPIEGADRPRLVRLRDKPRPGRRVFKAEVSMTRRADGAWDTTTKLFGAQPVRLIVHCGDDPEEAAADALSSAISDREDES